MLRQSTAQNVNYIVMNSGYSSRLETPRWDARTRPIYRWIWLFKAVRLNNEVGNELVSFAASPTDPNLSLNLESKIDVF